MILHGVDPELDTWVDNLVRMGAGSFLQAVHSVAVTADSDNYAMLRPVLLQLREKYPQYKENSREPRR
jgi:hypothetical protein